MDVRVADPADPRAEQLLAWYFEEHLRFPLLNRDREERAVTQIAEYGRALFRQVFSGQAGNGYRAACDLGLDGWRLVVEGSAAFHRLHWEALQDPEGGPPLAVRIPLARRVARTPVQLELLGERPVLNILVVTARPRHGEDVGHRTVSQPLLDAVRLAQIPVAVEVLRPGTWEALRERLERASAEHGAGWFQVVHFDVHGRFGTRRALRAGPGNGHFVFEADADPEEVEQGYLFLETDKAGQAHAVSAAQVARLLVRHGVAVTVLNACQSAMQTGDEASLAYELAAAGAPVAIGMAYSVTVSAVARSMPVFYRRLAAGDDPVVAALAMRRDLHEEKTRRGFFDLDLDLEDWLLPVVFGQRELSVRLRPMAPAESAGFYVRQAELSAEPPVEYGFVGRDLDVQEVERRLLQHPDTNELLVRGIAGAGKSTLLAHLGWWWLRTGLVEKVFSFSWAQRAWSVDQIVHQIARELPVDDEGCPDTLEAVIQRMRRSRHVLVIDDVESVTAGRAPVSPMLAPEEQDRLAELLARLRGGRTLVLIGSRGAESWLAASTFGDNVYDLPGLDPYAASTLERRVLARHGGAQHRGDAAEPVQRQALDTLATLLGGHPLAMTVVLSRVGTAPPAQVLAEFRAGAPSIDSAGFLHRAVQEGLDSVDPAVRPSMDLLAPFVTVVPTGEGLTAYQTSVESQAGVPIDLDAAVSEAIRVGLARPHPRLPGWALVAPMLPHVLSSRLADRPELRAAAQAAHHEYFEDFAGTQYPLLWATQREPIAAAHARARVCYAELITALEYGLRHGRTTTDLVRMIYSYLDETNQHDTLRQVLDDALATYPDTPGAELVFGLYNLHFFAGQLALHQHRLADAEQHFTTELAIKKRVNARHAYGHSHLMLGRVAEARRRYGMARRHYEQSLQLSLDGGDLSDAGSAAHALGIVAQMKNKLRRARQYFEQGSELKRRAGDRRSLASFHHHLGTIAHRLQRYDEARRHFELAVAIDLEFDDPSSAVGTILQQAQVAADDGQYDRAEMYCRKALEICLPVGDLRGEALAYALLSSLVKRQDRVDEAERLLRLALRPLVELGDHQHAAEVRMRLFRLVARRDQDASLQLLAAALPEERASLPRSARRLASLADLVRTVDPEQPVKLATDETASGS